MCSTQWWAAIDLITPAWSENKQWSKLRHSCCIKFSSVIPFILNRNLNVNPSSFTNAFTLLTSFSSFELRTNLAANRFPYYYRWFPWNHPHTEREGNRMVCFVLYCWATLRIGLWRGSALIHALCWMRSVETLNTQTIFAEWLRLHLPGVCFLEHSAGCSNDTREI